MIVSRRDDPDGIGRQRRSGSFARVFTSLRCRVRVYARAPLATVPHQRASRHPRNTVKFATFGSCETPQTRTAIRGSLRFAAVRVLRQRMSRGAPGPWVHHQSIPGKSREVSFWYRFRRSVRPLRVVVPAPNRRPAEQKTRATDADAASQATVTRLSLPQLVHPLTRMDELWLRDSRLARGISISRALRRRGGRSVETDPNARFFFVASSFARPPSNRRLNPSRPRARARASPLPPPPRTASNAQK